MLFHRFLRSSSHSVPVHFRTILKLWILVNLFVSVPSNVDASELDNEVEDMMDMGADFNVPIEVDLGVPDVQAIVGKLFSFSIPMTAFSSGSSSYELKVYEAGSKDKLLPNWLHFNKKTATLQGIPQMKNLGSTKLTVEAAKPTYSGLNSKSETTFNIEVKKPANMNSIPTDGMKTGSISKIVKCNSDEPATYISIQVDTDLDQNSAFDAVNLLSKLSREMGLPRDVVRLFSLEEGHSVFGASPSIDGGPGNTRVKRFTNSAVLQWQVGCSGSIHDHHKVLINKVESASKDGQLAEVLGSPIIGWLLSKDSVFMSGENEARKKRSIISDQPISNAYLPLENSFDDEFEESEPESRIIPSMVSPTFGMASASPSLEDQHPHHHRFKRKGRHARAEPVVHHKMADAFNMHFGGTPLMTPVLHPTRPTEGIISTVIDERTKPVLSIMTASPSIGLSSEIMPTPTIKTSVTEDVTPTKIPELPETTKAVKNFMPMITNRLKKLVNIAGKLFSYQIPEDTFTDFEEGNTRKLKLHFLTEEQTTLSKDSWIQFDPENQVIYSLPLDDNIGSYKFILEACDSEQRCARDTVDISVRQHRQSRAFHHMFTAKLKFESWKYTLLVDWKKLFVEKLASFFGDENTDAITIRSASNKLMQISWTNDTLPLHPCPTKTIENLYKHITAKRKQNHPSKRFREHMKCCFDILKISIEFDKSCEGQVTMTPTPIPTDGYTMPTKKIRIIDKLNTKPVVRNSIDIVNATVGQVLAYVIPHDTFYDEEDSKNGKLKLSLMDMNGAYMLNTSWIKFDPFSRELYGLPFEDDVGEQEYQITAMDSGFQSVRDVFIVKIHPKPILNEVIEFSLTLDHDYQSFRDDVSKQVKVVRNLATLMGDSDTSNISVNSINKGSVIFAWTNISISQQENPPRQAIDYVIQKMFYNNESMSQDLIDALKPDFKLLRANALPLANQLGKSTPTVDNVTPPIHPKKTEHATSNDDIYITTIIPAAIIAAMLIIAAIIACILYRKKRKGKMNMQDNTTFISKGIPIIFNDELDDNKLGQPANTKGKSPALLREEKPPLPPPEYPKGNDSDSEGADSPLLERREPHVPPHSWGRGPMEEPTYDSGAPSYEPPPPFSTNSNSRQTRPKPTPTYRNPPPYVPP